MKTRNLFILLFMLICSIGFSQEDQVQMADTFYKEGKIYVVIIIFSIVLLGLALYLFFIERKVKKLEEQLKEK
jgi:CcmD family protein